MRRSSSGRYGAAIATVQRMVDLRPDLASYSRVAYLRELHGDIAGAIDAMQLAVSAAGPATENTEYVRVQLGNLYFAPATSTTLRTHTAHRWPAYPDYVLPWPAWPASRLPRRPRLPRSACITAHSRFRCRRS